MKVKCIDNKDSLLSKNVLTKGKFQTSKLPLSINKEYNVYSICLYDGYIQYLLIGDQNFPSWYASELFEVVENILPFEFYFNCKKESNIETKWGYSIIIDAIWGYEEMVKDETHYADLLERDKKAIKIFLKRKKEIDEMLS